MARRPTAEQVYRITPIVPPSIVSGAVPVAHALYRENVVKAWGNVSVTPTLNDSFNMTSVADAGAGLTTVTVDRDFANTTYAPAGTISGGSPGFIHFDTFAAGSFRAQTRDSAGTSTDLAFLMVIMGDQ